MSKLSGLTTLDCASACTAEGCVIAAGQPHCMHPCKGGVPEAFRSDPAIQAVYDDACIKLGVKGKHSLEGSAA